jgi:hypothetical protein
MRRDTGLDASDDRTGQLDGIADFSSDRLFAAHPIRALRLRSVQMDFLSIAAKN